MSRSEHSSRVLLFILFTNSLALPVYTSALPLRTAEWWFPEPKISRMRDRGPKPRRPFRRAVLALESTVFRSAYVAKRHLSRQYMPDVETPSLAWLHIGFCCKVNIKKSCRRHTLRRESPRGNRDKSLFRSVGYLRARAFRVRTCDCRSCLNSWPGPLSESTYASRMLWCIKHLPSTLLCLSPSRPCGGPLVQRRKKSEKYIPKNLHL